MMDSALRPVSMRTRAVWRTDASKKDICRHGGFPGKQRRAHCFVDPPLYTRACDEVLWRRLRKLGKPFPK